MSGALALRPPGSLAALDGELLEALRRTIAPGLSTSELELFGRVCQRTGLDAFRGEVRALKIDGRLNIHVGIDGLRVLAQRSGVYAGQLGPWWKAQGGEWLDVWEDDAPPFAAKVEVLRADFAAPTRGIARYSSFVRRTREGHPAGLWRSAPEVMLAIRAEASALRRAFPAETSGLAVTVDDDDRGAVSSSLRPPIVNPDAPATPEQMGTLHQIARARGWSDDERHERAGVASFAYLTKAQASELIDDWSTIEDPGDEAREPTSSGMAADAAEVGRQEAARTLSSSRPASALAAEPATGEQWQRAVGIYGSRAAVLRRIIELCRPGQSASAASVTSAELEVLLSDGDAGEGIR